MRQKAQSRGRGNREERRAPDSAGNGARASADPARSGGPVGGDRVEADPAESDKEDNEKLIDDALKQLQ